MFDNLSKKFVIISSIIVIISVIFVLFNYKTRGLAYYGPHINENRQYMESHVGMGSTGNSNIELWLSFIGILSTLFAVFFVYTGFKIENTKEKIDSAEKRIFDLERKIQEEVYEYARQLEYCMSYIIQKQFDKALDALVVLRSEPFVLKDDRKINTCCFFLAHCYYEKGLSEKDDVKKKENIAVAVEYINQAISDPAHPFKNEIINAFNELDQQSTI